MGWFDGVSESGRSHSSKRHSSHSHSSKKRPSSSHSSHHNNSSGLLGSVLGGTSPESPKSPRSPKSPKSCHSHRERSRSRTRGTDSIFGSGDAKHNSSRSSIFGMYFCLSLQFYRYFRNSICLISHVVVA